MPTPEDSMADINDQTSGATYDQIQLSDEESVDSEEARDLVNVPAVDGVHAQEQDESVDEKKSKKRKKSEVWNHFVEVKVKHKGELVNKFECIYCKHKYAESNGGPTSTLKRHLERCAAYKMSLGNKKSLLNFESCDNDSTPSLNASGGYDQMKCRELIAKMIIAHELPFSFVEYHWFNQLMKYNNPYYQKVSRATITRDCIKVVEVEREKMKKLFKNIDMISLTSDCWTSNQTIGYMCLTAHYVDSDWKLQKRIIGFSELAPPHSGEVISDGILECLIKWGIQDKIGAITLDNASNNDRAASILENNFKGKGKLHFEGLFFHVRCCAHILNLVVQDGLGIIDSCLMKIREGVKYLRKSPGRLLKFGEIAITLGIQTRQSLCTDMKTRWNSTHRMLESAIHYKLAFQGYALRDSNFAWLPTDVEWDRAEKVCNLLEVFLDASNLFSSTSYPTANLFLVEIFRVKKEIANAYASEDIFLKSMSMPMYGKFEKYWGEIGLLMSITSILDPRFKLVSLHWTFERLYPYDQVHDRVGEVAEKLRSLFEKYSKAFIAARAATSSSNAAASAADPTDRVQKDDFYAFLKSMPVEPIQKSELDVYLEESNFIVEENNQFDVLKWWSLNYSKFPILSKLARDIFCIPITTVASESAFSAGCRVLDDYRSSLSKDMVELLVCGGDWIKAASKAFIKTIIESAQEEEDLDIKIPMSNLTIN